MINLKFTDYETQTINSLEQITKTLQVLEVGSAYYEDCKSFKKFKDAFYNLSENIRQSYTKRYTDENTREFTKYLEWFNQKFDEVLNLKKVDVS